MDGSRRRGTVSETKTHLDHKVRLPDTNDFTKGRTGLMDFKVIWNRKVVRMTLVFVSPTITY